MGEGLAQIGVILAVTVVGLPLFFFALLAALDHFERTISQPRAAAPSASAQAPAAGSAAADDERTAEVLPLPLPAASASSAAAV